MTTNSANFELPSIGSSKDFDDLIKSESIQETLFLVHVELEQIPVCKTVNEALLAIRRENPQLNICRLNADHFLDFLTANQVTAAPTVLFYHRMRLIDRVAGFNQAELLKKIALHLRQIATMPKKIESTKNEADLNIEKKIENLLRSSRVLLFMKGTPNEPQCGFSRQACHLLDEHKIKYTTFDVLSDPNLREQLKKYSNWNTYPQLYIQGELIGGLDVMKQMIENGEFEQRFQERDINQYLEKLIHRAPLMLFIVGTPQAPQCRFTKQLFQLLNEVNIHDYQTFDVLQDEEVQEKLKDYSSWQTYPQIYVNGQLIGGVDILKQLNEQGVLVETLTGKQGVAV